MIGECASLQSLGASLFVLISCSECVEGLGRSEKCGAFAGVCGESDFLGEACEEIIFFPEVIGGDDGFIFCFFIIELSNDFLLFDFSSKRPFF